jgi:hypothetical protein
LRRSDELVVPVGSVAFAVPIGSTWTASSDRTAVEPITAVAAELPHTLTTTTWERMIS